MNQNNNTFNSENLVIDYMSFKFQELEYFNREKIANYLFQIGFNSYQESAKLVKPMKEPILVHSKNKFDVWFVGDHTFWDGTLLHFSGRNASRFYFLWKEKTIDWTIFSSGVLSRLDLCYSRPKKKDDKMSIPDFLHQSFGELQQTKRKVNLDQNPKGSILKIGSRQSDLFYRIYDGESFVKFELEMKGKFIEKYHSLLVDHQLEEFEKQLSSHFVLYSAKTLPLNYSYMDWLVIKLRPIRYQQVPKNSLKLHYLYVNSFESFDDRRDFLYLLQFLIYAQKLDYISASLNTTCYRQVSFRLQDFLKYHNPNLNSTSHYQVKKFIYFFEKLQENSLLRIFSDSGFRSLMTIPEVELEKTKNSIWIVKVWIAEELFYYAHPFILPNFSKQKFTKDEVEVHFKALQIYSSINLEKKFLIQEFLDSYPSVISNSKKKNIKKLFLQFVDSLKEHNLIESNYKVFSNGSYRSVEELNTANISEGFIIYEKLQVKN